MPNPLRVAVIGAGAFGRNHLRVLHDLTEQTTASALAQDRVPHPARSDGWEAIQLAALVEPDRQTRAEAATRYGIPAFASVDELLAAGLGLHAATVAVPTVAHASVAEQLLRAGIDVLVEKPLTTTLAEADHLIALAARLGRILAAGHLERFNPAVTAALPRLTRPMFFEAHRLSVFTPRSLDVDVVLDLMIHDLDILLTMAHSPVHEVRAVGLPVLSRKVDIANVRLEFASGAVANLTASRVSTEQVRKLRLFQPAQYLSLDYARQELLTINVDPALAAAMTRIDKMDNGRKEQEVQSLNLRSAGERTVATRTQLSLARQEGDGLQHVPPRPHEPAALAAEGAARETGAIPHPSPGLTFEKLDLPRAEPLRLELEDFLHAVATGAPPRVTAAAAREALALALEINAAIAGHAHRAGLA